MDSKLITSTGREKAEYALFEQFKKDPILVVVDKFNLHPFSKNCMARQTCTYGERSISDFIQWDNLGVRFWKQSYNGYTVPELLGEYYLTWEQIESYAKAGEKFNGTDPASVNLVIPASEWPKLRALRKLDSAAIEANVISFRIDETRKAIKEIMRTQKEKQ